jgi:hypothetical protein
MLAGDRRLLMALRIEGDDLSTDSISIKVKKIGKACR